MAKKSVRVEVAEERKETWDEQAEREDRSLSDVLRRAMSEYIASQEGEGGEGGIPESVEKEVYRTGDGVVNLQQQVSSLADRFDVIENELEQNKELRTVANDIYEILPGAKRVGEHTETAEGTQTVVGSLGWIADTLGETEGMVEQATDLLLAENYNVHEIGPESGGGEPLRYYKEGGDR